MSEALIDNPFDGPWVVEKHVEKDKFYVCHPGTFDTCSCVCIVEDISHEGNERRAHLIGVAPELYEAAAALHDYVNRLPVAAQDQKLQDLLIGVAHAIAKANGELPND